MVQWYKAKKWFRLYKAAKMNIDKRTIFRKNEVLRVQNTAHIVLN